MNIFQKKLERFVQRIGDEEQPEEAMTQYTILKVEESGHHHPVAWTTTEEEAKTFVTARAAKGEYYYRETSNA